MLLAENAKCVCDFPVIGGRYNIALALSQKVKTEMMKQLITLLVHRRTDIRTVDWNPSTDEGLMVGEKEKGSMPYQQVAKSLPESIGLFTPKIEITGRIRRVVTVTASEGRTYFAVAFEDRSEPYRVFTYGGIDFDEAIALLEPGTTVKLVVKAGLAEFESSKSYFRVVSKPEVVAATI